MNARPRNDGRGRAVWPPVAARESDPPALLAYVEPEPGKLRVFRCRDCCVRVAQEADAVGVRPSMARGLYGATFGRTFNLVAADDSVCCVRCGKRQFGFDARDPALLTLPLFDEEGARTFDKTAMRCVVVQDVGVTVIFKNTEEMKARPVDDDVMRRHRALAEMIPPMYPDRDVEVTHILRYGFFEQDGENWRDFTDVGYFRALYRDAGATFHLMPAPETGEALDAVGTQDFALMFYCLDDNDDFLQWTDFNAAYLEPCLLRLWMLSGGNLLFGDWWLPMYAKEKSLAELDFAELAHEFQNSNGTNAQRAFAQLVRDGHYVGFWTHKEERPPQAVHDNVRGAIDYKLLYPRWLFLRDFPPSQFTNLERRANEQAFAESAEDAVVPRPRSTHRAPAEPQIPESNCALL